MPLPPFAAQLVAAVLLAVLACPPSAGAVELEDAGIVGLFERHGDPGARLTEGAVFSGANGESYRVLERLTVVGASAIYLLQDVASGQRLVGKVTHDQIRRRVGFDAIERGLAHTHRTLFRNGAGSRFILPALGATTLAVPKRTFRAVIYNSYQDYVDDRALLGRGDALHFIGDTAGGSATLETGLQTYRIAEQGRWSHTYAGDVTAAPLTLPDGTVDQLLRLETSGAGTLAFARALADDALDEPTRALLAQRKVARYTQPEHSFFVTLMEETSGETLQSLIDRRFFEQKRRPEIGTRLKDLRFYDRVADQLFEAQATLAGKGILHSDIKPENVALSGRYGSLGRPMSWRATVARVLEGKTRTLVADHELATEPSVGVERAGFNELYAAPEQLAVLRDKDGASKLGTDADLYGVGVTLYTLVFGENPHEAARTLIPPDPWLSGYERAFRLDIEEVRRRLAKPELARRFLRQIAGRFEALARHVNRGRGAPQKVALVRRLEHAVLGCMQPKPRARRPYLDAFGVGAKEGAPRKSRQP